MATVIGTTQPIMRMELSCLGLSIVAHASGAVHQVRSPSSYLPNMRSIKTDSITVNGQVWYRPTEAEINKLETLGNPGWNWENLEPVCEIYFSSRPPLADISG